MPSKTSSELCETSGFYCCLYHIKNKIKVLKGNTFPRCNFADINCNGTWHLSKEIIEKTHEEKSADNNYKRMQQRRRSSLDTDFQRELKKPNHNKWDFEKW